MYGLTHFYSRPCGRGDREPGCSARCCSRFLLTPLREGRPERRITVYNARTISTHAPAGGATRGAGAYLTDRLISTHAPAGGATAGNQRKGEQHTNFYSRPCGRGDCVFSKSKRSSYISTHAPAGGATPAVAVASPAEQNFYSRPCGRGDSNFPQVRHEVLRQIAER